MGICGDSALSLVIAAFTHTPISAAVSDSFLLILGYVFGHTLRVLRPPPCTADGPVEGAPRTLARGNAAWLGSIHPNSALTAALASNAYRCGCRYVMLSALPGEEY